jgi:ABC-2 type transport system permease protein
MSQSSWNIDVAGWRSVAQTDVRRARRTPIILLLLSIVMITSVGYSLAYRYVESSQLTFMGFVDGSTTLLSFVIPVVGLLLGYKSIAHARETGSVLLTLSFPQSRAGLIIGTLLSRWTLLIITTVTGLSLSGGIAAILYGTQGITTYPLVVLLTLLYSAAFVGIGVGISIVTTNERWITLSTFGSYFVLIILWDGLTTAIMLVLHRFDFSVLASPPDWTLLVRLLSPESSYNLLLRLGGGIDVAGQYVADSAPVYIGWWVAVGVLVIWMSLPVVLGFYRFRTAEL